MNKIKVNFKKNTNFEVKEILSIKNCILLHIGSHILIANIDILRYVNHVLIRHHWLPLSCKMSKNGQTYFKYLPGVRSKKAPPDFLKFSHFSTCMKALRLRACNLVVRDLRSKAKNSRFQFGHYLCAEVSPLQ